MWVLYDVRIFIWTCGHTDLYGFLIFEKTDFYHYHLATLVQSCTARIREYVCRIAAREYRRSDVAYARDSFGRPFRARVRSVYVTK